MPNRLLRDSILASRTLAELSDFAGRLFFHLLVVADDYGRFNSDPEVVRSVCFPLRTDAIRITRIEKALDELILSGIARFYFTDTKVIGEIVNFTKFQAPRAKKSKFSAPRSEFLCTFANIREQLRAVATQTDHARDLVDRNRDRTSVVSDPDLDLVGEQFEEFCQAYPRRQGKDEAEAAWRKLNPSEELRKQILVDIITRYRGTETKFVPMPAKYLEGARWKDEIILGRARAETPIDISKRLIHEAEVEADGDNRGSQTHGDAGGRVPGMEGDRRNSAPLRRIT
jgi:hypothetical protein